MLIPCYLARRSVTTMTNKKDLTKYVWAFTLGDGGLSSLKSYNRKENKINTSGRKITDINSHYYIKQLSIHDDYILWQASILEQITNVTIKHNNGYVDDRGYTIKPQTVLTTRNHPFYTILRERIYNNGVKTISIHDLKLLDWQCMAIFYMDDGWLETKMNKNGTMYVRIGIASHSFSEAENYILTAAIKEKLGVRFETKKHKQRSGIYKYYIRTSKYEANKFLEGVRPFILPSFEYKLVEQLAPLNKGDDIV